LLSPVIGVVAIALLPAMLFSMTRNLPVNLAKLQVFLTRALLHGWFETADALGQTTLPDDNPTTHDLGRVMEKTTELS